MSNVTTPTPTTTPSWVADERYGRLRQAIGDLRRWYDAQLDAGLGMDQYTAEEMLRRLAVLETGDYLPPTDTTTSANADLKES